ncbi:hypothetical protein JL722_825 [Aureococcus anophagefferens]|nr:hypothetical protein JL722_825 [Aureococcus anophagefferens]
MAPRRSSRLVETAAPAEEGGDLLKVLDDLEAKEALDVSDVVELYRALSLDSAVDASAEARAFALVDPAVQAGYAGAVDAVALEACALTLARGAACPSVAARLARASSSARAPPASRAATTQTSGGRAPSRSATTRPRRCPPRSGPRRRRCSALASAASAELRAKRPEGAVCFLVDVVARVAAALTALRRREAEAGASALPAGATFGGEAGACALAGDAAPLEQTVALQQLVLNGLEERASERWAAVARKFAVAKWFGELPADAEALRAHLAGQFAGRSALMMRRGDWDVLTHQVAALLGHDGAAVRCRALKALDGVARERGGGDAPLLRDPVVRRAVLSRFLDEAISVRAAAVDLLRELHKRTLLALLDRASRPKEEQTVKDLVGDVIRDAWFAERGADEAAAPEKVSPSSVIFEDVAQKELPPLDATTRQIVDVAAAARGNDGRVAEVLAAALASSRAAGSDAASAKRAPAAARARKPPRRAALGAATRGVVDCLARSALARAAPGAVAGAAATLAPYLRADNGLEPRGEAEAVSLVAEILASARRVARADCAALGRVASPDLRAVVLSLGTTPTSAALACLVALERRGCRAARRSGGWRVVLRAAQDGARSSSSARSPSSGPTGWRGPPADVEEPSALAAAKEPLRALHRALVAALEHDGDAPRDAKIDAVCRAVAGRPPLASALARRGVLDAMLGVGPAAARALQRPGRACSTARARPARRTRRPTRGR